MSNQNMLRGSCFCGRNQYVIQIPKDSAESARVVFDSDPEHRIASASPLSAFIRVPLSWYHSRVFPFFPDETRSGIRRTYSHPAEQHILRHFCGFCGTPLSYWSESPRTEADYIQLTLGSLLTDDLHDLEDMGLIIGPNDDNVQQTALHHSTVHEQPQRSSIISRETFGIPWFNTLLTGSKLNNVRTSRGVEHHGDGRIRVEWEVTEWEDGADDSEDAEMTEEPAANKRKRPDADDSVPAVVTARRTA